MIITAATPKTKQLSLPKISSLRINTEQYSRFNHLNYSKEFLQSKRDLQVTKVVIVTDQKFTKYWRN